MKYRILERNGVYRAQYQSDGFWFFLLRGLAGGMPVWLDVDGRQKTWVEAEGVIRTHVARRRAAKPEWRVIEEMTEEDILEG